ncbi:MAG: glycosyltransferase [Bacteroidota bacterium]|nr:glycosyltransferase [Bacteroidota bacterium]
MLKFFFAFWSNCIGFLELIGLPLAVISLAIILFYYLYFFIKLHFYKSKSSAYNQPISIIICAKNELDNLRKNLPIILEQNYFDFEVIVVNDQSIDESIFFLDQLAKQNKHLVVVDIDNFVTHSLGKKFALTLGIKTAKYEHLLLTDADCIPNSKNWIQQMSSNFNNAAIILGYGSYEKKKGLLNKIIRFDTFNVAQQYLSFALVGQTYMGVGRNLAYKKSLFFDNKGFASHIHIPSGDDDLFIQEIALKSTVTIEILEDSHTTSEVIQNWKDWIYQKRRHLSTGPLYRTKFKILLALYPLAQLLFLLSIIFLIISKTDLLYIIILLGVKLLISYLVNYKTMQRLNVFDLYWIHPLYEILHLLIQGNFVLLNLFRKPKKWSR